MAYRKGEIVLVNFPFTDFSMSKVRPAMVVSSNLYHAEKPDLMLAALTSKVAEAINVTSRNLKSMPKVVKISTAVLEYRI